MSSLLEKVIEEVKSLSPEDQQQLRDFLNEQALSAEQKERDRLAGSIRGKYVGILTSSDDFAVRKAEEMELEDRR